MTGNGANGIGHIRMLRYNRLCAQNIGSCIQKIMDRRPNADNWLIEIKTHAIAVVSAGHQVLQQGLTYRAVVHGVRLGFIVKLMFQQLDGQFPAQRCQQVARQLLNVLFGNGGKQPGQALGTAGIPSAELAGDMQQIRWREAATLHNRMRFQAFDGKGRGIQRSGYLNQFGHGMRPASKQVHNLALRFGQL